MDSPADYLGNEGPFAKQSSDFQPRQAQIEMANCIAQVIEQGETLLAESGTGTGKTYAYLVPALLSGQKTVISTGTKHLQEQLFHRDIPRVVDALAVSVKVALLKGRSNYLCLHRLQQARTSSRRLDLKQRGELEAIVSWLPRTKLGDIAEVKDVSESSMVWSNVTSTVDNCIGQNCSYYEDCYVNKARKKAATSDLIVVNHHLYFADKALKNDGFGALLPDAKTIIFDEAHQLPDIASNFLGTSFSSWQVLELCSDTRAAELKEKSGITDLINKAGELEKTVSDYRLSFGLQERRLAWTDAQYEIPALDKKIQHLATLLSEFSDVLEQAAVKGEALTRCFERSLDMASTCQQIVDQQESIETVRWVEISRKNFRIHDTPLDVGAALSRYFGNQQQARVFTSATLSVNGEFGHFSKSMGLSSDAKTVTWDSPFDFFEQSVLYVPEGLPEPRSADFPKSFFDATLPLLRASGGATFVLFTSFKQMELYWDALDEQVDAKEFTVLMQGQTTKRELLSQFETTNNAVLLGTMSFWEGVDVPGDALRCVIIDKLPFESPFDPVIKARLKAMEEAGENPFMTHQVPRAVITLRQGAGRLIRSSKDRGVLMICDARLRRTHYGRIFLDSLPRMRRTSDQAKVCGFLNAIKQGVDAAAKKELIDAEPIESKPGAKVANSTKRVT